VLVLCLMFASVLLEDSSLFLRNTKSCFVTVFDLEADSSQAPCFMKTFGVVLPFLLQAGHGRGGCVSIWVGVRC